MKNLILKVSCVIFESKGKTKARLIAWQIAQ